MTPSTLVIAVLTFVVPQTPLPKGFAHNDYAHPRPLEDSLAAGFQHVEADVFLVGSKFFVAHDAKDIRSDRTLEALYLKPLFRKFQANGGSVFHGHRFPFWLMIDVKSPDPRVYSSLELLLAGYRRMLVSWTDAGASPGAVAIVLSGHRPVAEVARQTLRWVAIDGRPEDLIANPPVGLMPWISTSYLGFRSPLPNSPADRVEAISQYVARCRVQGRKVRFWAIPDHPKSWQEQLDWGVDLVNTDRPAEFAAWCAGRRLVPTASP